MHGFMADTVRWQTNEVFIRYGEDGKIAGAHVGFLLFALNADGTVNTDIRPTEKVMPVVDGVVAGFQFDTVMTGVLADAIVRGDLFEAKAKEAEAARNAIAGKTESLQKALADARAEIQRRDVADRRRAMAAEQQQRAHAARKAQEPGWFKLARRLAGTAA